MEIFVTDAPEVDFDKLNEEQSRDLREKFEMVDQQSQGVINKEISGGAAYKYFRDLQTAQYLFDPTEQDLQEANMEQSGMRSVVELPYQRLKRLQKELEELEAELKQMEKDEIPSNNFGCLSESELALQEIDFMREQMRAVSDSQPFKAYDSV